MHTSKLDSLKKVWIPESYAFDAEPQIARYIALQGLDPNATLRFSGVQGKNFNELFIPSTMVVAADEYGIFAHCYASLDALRAGMASDNLVTPGATVDYTAAEFAGPMPA